MSSTTMTAQAGWYAVGGGYERYWNGLEWTERLRPVPSYVRPDVVDAALLRLGVLAAG